MRTLYGGRIIFSVQNRTCFQLLLCRRLKNGIPPFKIFPADAKNRRLAHRLVPLLQTFPKRIHRTGHIVDLEPRACQRRLPAECIPFFLRPTAEVQDYVDAQTQYLFCGIPHQCFHFRMPFVVFLVVPVIFKIVSKQVDMPLIRRQA